MVLWRGEDPVLLGCLGYAAVTSAGPWRRQSEHWGSQGPPTAGCLSPASEPPYHRLLTAASLSAVPAPSWRQPPLGLSAG